MVLADKSDNKLQSIIGDMCCARCSFRGLSEEWEGEEVIKDGRLQLPCSLLKYLHQIVRFDLLFRTLFPSSPSTDSVQRLDCQMNMWP